MAAVKMSMTATATASALSDMGGHQFHVAPGTVPAAIVLATMPFWLPSLSQLSETAGQLAPIIGLGVGLSVIYRNLRGDEKGAKVAEARGKTLSDVLTSGGRLAASGARTFGIFAAAFVAGAALLAYATKRDAHAAPVPTVATAAKPKRRSADDAGDDGDSPEPLAVDGAPKWFTVLSDLRGHHEGTKRKPSPIVQAMFASAGHPGIKDTTGVAWCAAAVAYAFDKAGIPPARTLSARDWLKWGVALDAPRAGCVVVFWRGSKSSWQGHVGLYVREDATHIYLLGGNQSDAVSVARFPKSRVLGFRWPRKLSDTSTAKSAVGAAVAATGAAGAAAIEKIPEAKEALTPVKTALEQTGASWAVSAAAWLGVALAVLAVVGAVYALRGRKKAGEKNGF